MGVLDSIAKAWKDRVVIDCTGSKFDSKLIFPSLGVIGNVDYQLTTRLQLNRCGTSHDRCTESDGTNRC